MGGEIRVRLDLLLGVERQLDGLTFHTSSGVQRDFSRSGPVEAAYDELMRTWDQRRGELNHGLSQLAAAVRSVRVAFEDLDRQHASALGDSTGEVVTTTQTSSS